ncbi:MAG: histidinol-phosphatase [Treponema sp.]|jgi:histidinol-phosphatase (PHP family)|nr:histidinol-phosphatase [Treponema sp.]
MIRSCLHTHTTFCDGADDVETMCAAAAARGLAAIGFSSHAPIAKKTGIKTSWHLPDEKLDEYLETVLAAKKRWRGRLEVFLGLEVDYIQGLCGPADGDYQSLPLDYIIGSVHFAAPPERGFTVDAPEEEFLAGFRDIFQGDGTALYNAYYDAYRGMIEEGGFDIAGHLDLVKKNNGLYRFFSPEDPAYGKRLLETADCLAAASGRPARETTGNGAFPVVVEVNTGGMNRGRVSEPYPSRAVLKLLRERNVPLTVTADAHSAEHLGGHYEEARNAMMDAGYSSALRLAEGKDGKALWLEEPLTARDRGES